MAKRYIKIGWENKPSVKTPVSAANLGHMDAGIDDCDNAIEEIYAKRVNNVVTTNEDTFLAGPVGKVLQDQVTELNKNLALKLVSDCDNAVYVLNQRTRYYCTTGTNAPVSGVATFVIDAIGDTNTINYVQEAICTYKGVTTAIVGQRFFRSHTSAGFGEWKSYSVM